MHLKECYPFEGLNGGLILNLIKGVLISIMISMNEEEVMILECWVVVQIWDMIPDDVGVSIQMLLNREVFSVKE
jgi:hypothetical protein